MSHSSAVGGFGGVDIGRLSGKVIEIVAMTENQKSFNIGFTGSTLPVLGPTHNV